MPLLLSIFIAMLSLLSFRLCLCLLLSSPLPLPLPLCLALTITFCLRLSDSLTRPLPLPLSLYHYLFTSASALFSLPRPRLHPLYLFCHCLCLTLALSLTLALCLTASCLVPPGGALRPPNVLPLPCPASLALFTADTRRLPVCRLPISAFPPTPCLCLTLKAQRRAACVDPSAATPSALDAIVSTTHVVFLPG